MEHGEKLEKEENGGTGGIKRAEPSQGGHWAPRGYDVISGGVDAEVGDRGNPAYLPRVPTGGREKRRRRRRRWCYYYLVGGGADNARKRPLGPRDVVGVQIPPLGQGCRE